MILKWVLSIWVYMLSSGRMVPLDTKHSMTQKSSLPPPHFRMKVKQGACGFHLRARQYLFQHSICWGLLLVKLSHNRICLLRAVTGTYALSCQSVFFQFTEQLLSPAPLFSPWTIPPLFFSGFPCTSPRGNWKCIFSSEMEMRPRAFKGTPLV